MATRYLLDTNICIYIARNRPESVRKRFEKLSKAELAISVVTLGELRFGAEKSQSRSRALEVIAGLVNAASAFELPLDAAAHYGEIRASLQKRGLIIGNNDLWLAAHARSQGWTLVTHNTGEFKRVPGLKVEDWAS